MTTVASAFNHSAPEEGEYGSSDLLSDSTVLVGIEHEFEGFQRTGNLPDEWRVESDGSLRDNGVEFILRSPLAGQLLVDAITDFDEYYKNSQLRINERTSTHVHIDVRNLTVEQYRNCVFVYLLLEPILFGLCHPSRVGNPYCAHLSHSTTMGHTFRELLRGTLGGEMFSEGMRYGAISLNATRTLGSLEFRMRETIPTTEDFLPWVNILLEMRMFATSKCSPDYINFLRRVESRDAGFVLSYILGEDSARYILDNVDNVEQRLSDGVDACLIFANY